MTIPGPSSDSTSGANYAVSPEYVSVIPVSTLDDTTTSDALPVATAYALSDEEDARYAPTQGAVASAPFSSSLPTSTPTIGSMTHGPMYSSTTAAPEQFQYSSTSAGAPYGDVNNHSSYASPQVTSVNASTTMYPAPPLAPPGRSNNATGCIICGSVAVTAAIVFCFCCLVPVIIVIAAVSQSQVPGADIPWDDDFVNMMDDQFVNGTYTTAIDDAFLQPNGTQ